MYAEKTEDGKAIHVDMQCSTHDGKKYITEPIRTLRSLLPSSFQMSVSKRFEKSGAMSATDSDPKHTIVTIVFPRQYNKTEISQMKERIKEFSVYNSRDEENYELLKTTTYASKYGYFRSEEYKRNRDYIVNHLNSYAMNNEEKIKQIDIDYLVFTAYSSYPKCNYEGMEQSALSKANIEKEYIKCGGCSKDDIKQKMKLLISRDVKHSLLSIRDELDEIISSPYKNVIGDCEIVRSATVGTFGLLQFVSMESSDIVEKIYGVLVHNIGSTLTKQDIGISQVNTVPRPVYESVEVNSESGVSITIYSNDIMKFPYTLSDFIRKWEEV